MINESFLQPVIHSGLRSLHRLVCYVEIMASKKPECLLYCDGACRGNPGISSYGVFARLSDHTTIGHGGMFLGLGTNNTAEWHGAIGALEFAKEILDSHAQHDIGRVIIRMDSILVVNQVTGAWKIKEPRLKTLHDQAIALIELISVPVRFEWIPREENTDADRIANQCLNEQSHVGITLTPAKRDDHSTMLDTSCVKHGRKTRRVQFSLDEETYTAFQQAVRANQETTTHVLVEAVKYYLAKQ